MSDLICKDGSFPQEALNFYAKHGVLTPEEGKMYTCREVVSHSIGKKGIRLEELVNPKVPVDTGIIKGSIEPSWALNRFQTLAGEQVTAEMLKQTTKV